MPQTANIARGGLGPPVLPVVPFYPFFLGEGSTTNIIDYRKKVGTLILSSLLEDLEVVFAVFSQMLGYGSVLFRIRTSKMASLVSFWFRFETQRGYRPPQQRHGHFVV